MQESQLHRFDLDLFGINDSKRGFRVVVANADPAYGVELKSNGQIMRTEFIGWTDDGHFEIRSLRACCIEWFQVKGLDGAPQLVAGEEYVRGVTEV